MFSLVANGFVLIGAGILVASLLPVSRLIRRLPEGPFRRRWYVLGTLILGFIAGYLGYVVAFWTRHSGWADLIVPAMFFFGACFVWLTSTLSLETAIDVRKVALLEQESITDPLTGLYNRRYLDRRIEEEFRRAQRYGIPWSILMLDIDHFKGVNDTLGHAAGDLVLRDLARLVVEVARNSDIVARYGGEEFLIMAPNTPAEAVVTLAERLRGLVESHSFTTGGEPGREQRLRLTVSIGVAGSGREIGHASVLVRRADEALYRAKEDGRNRIAVHREGRPQTIGSPAEAA